MKQAPCKATLYVRGEVMAVSTGPNKRQARLKVLHTREAYNAWTISRHSCRIVYESQSDAAVKP